MKRVYFLKLAALMAAAAVTPSAMAGDLASARAVDAMSTTASLEIQDFSIAPGGTYLANVNINPGADDMPAYSGVQFELSQLPQGVTLDLSKSTVNLPGFYELKENSNGTIRLLTYAEDAAITTTDNIITLAFTAAEDAPETEVPFKVDITGLDFSSPKGIDIYGVDSYFYITVTNEPYVPEVPATAITVEPKTLEMMVGDAPFQLTATVSPADATNKDVVWSSSDPAIATVDANGYVTPVAPGVCKVTATVAGTDLSDYCDVTVTKEEKNPYDGSDIDVKTYSDPAPNYGDIIVVKSGTNVKMWADAKGGNPDGWSYSWKLQGNNEVIGTQYSLDAMQINDSEEPLTNVYVLTLTNSWKDETIFSADYTFTVEVWKDGEFIPNNPGDDHAGWYPAGNGTYVSEIRIREGNELGLYVLPKGGYMNEWTYLWEGPDAAGSYVEIGDEQEIYTPAILQGAAANSGVNQATCLNTYRVTATNYGPTGEIWKEETLNTVDVKVYKRPQIPTQLLRKGQHPTGGQTPETGTSCTFVVMMTPLDNQQILDLGYSYTYGYTDASGVMNVLETTELRYSHTTSEIYNNSTYKFWAYSQWTYPDGSVVTSGLRYLDGGEDPYFDASVFSGSKSEDTIGTAGVDGVEADETVNAIYTVDGRYVGTDASALARGIYVIRTNKSTKKVII